MFTTGDKPHNKYEFNYDIIDHFIVIPLENVENTKMNGSIDNTVMVATTTHQYSMDHSSVYNVKWLFYFNIN